MKGPASSRQSVISVLYLILQYSSCFNDSNPIDPRNQPRVLINGRGGTTNDDGHYVPGRLDREYYLDIDGKYVNADRIQALQSHVRAFDSPPGKDETALFRCRRRFRVGGRPCGDDEWVEGRVVKVDRDTAEILAAHCDPSRSATTFRVIEESLAHLRRIERRRAEEILGGVCAGNEGATSFLFQRRPECRVFEFRLAYPRQSLVRVRTEDGASTMIRTDIESRRPPVVLDRVPAVAELLGERAALVRKGRAWKWRQIAVEAEENSTKPRISYAVGAKKKKAVQLEDVRILRGRILSLCESVAQQPTPGSSSGPTNHRHSTRGHDGPSVRSDPHHVVCYFVASSHLCKRVGSLVSPHVRPLPFGKGCRKR